MAPVRVRWWAAAVGVAFATCPSAAQPVTAVPVLADYWGTTYTTVSPCSNALTCSPAQCVRNSQPACAVSRNGVAGANATDASLQSGARVATLGALLCV